jgi:hypothetical protein
LRARALVRNGEGVFQEVEAWPAMPLTALLREAEQHAPGPAGFDAVVIGSAVYAGRCRPRPPTDVRGSTAVGLLVGGG